jgi:hypothetical protein
MEKIILFLILLAVAGFFLRGIFVIAFIGLRFVWNVVTFPFYLIIKFSLCLEAVRIAGSSK